MEYTGETIAHPPVLTHFS